MNSIGLYIHIPFCLKKCNYCDFLSFDHQDRRRYKNYVNALKSEIRQYGKVYSNKLIVDTVFLGGGTPSIVDADLMAEILAEVKASFLLVKDAEITMEMNPKTVTEEKLQSYFAQGINRLSIGAQSFDDQILKLLGRAHQVEDILQTFEMARKQKFCNINIDLMFAVPTHKMSIWEETLTKVVQLSPEHLSFYSLQLEEGTKFFEQFQQGILEQISDEEDREMYHYAVDFAQANGYQPYEISNCAKPGYECQHNLKYWSLEPYLGLGLGAHSFVNHMRFSNTKDMKDYLNSFLDPEAPYLCEKISGQEQEIFLAKSVDWYYINGFSDLVSEYMFTGLRKTKGINLDDFARKFGRDLFEIYEAERPKLEQYIAEEYLILEGNQLRFSPTGIDISNTILTEFV